jgi:hypothetical protein
MKDNDDKRNSDETTDDKLKISDPIAALRKLSDEHKKAELIAESEREQKAAEYERKRREAYERQLADERRELLKKKAGIVEDETDSGEEKSEEVKMPLGKRIANFWYHNKITVIVTTIVVIGLSYFIGELIFRVEPDVRIMYIASDYQISVLYDEIAEALTPYCPDFNGDGKIYVEVSYTPAMQDESLDPEYIQSMSARLFVEFSSDQTILVFIDEAAAEFLDIKHNVFDNPADFGYKAGTYNDMGYFVSATDLAKLIDYPDLDRGVVAAFRFPKESMGNPETFEQNYQNAHTLWNNFITGNVVSPDAVNYNPN